LLLQQKIGLNFLEINRESFQSVLLSAGYGTRLRPLTDIWPKCLMPVHGRALLEYWLSDLIRVRSQSIFVNTHYYRDIVELFLAREVFSEKVTVFREDNLLGTAGTIAALAPQLGEIPTLIAHADNWSDINIPKFLRAHFYDRPSNCAITMATFMTEDTSSCGIVSVNNESIVSGFKEKPKHSLSKKANAAVYIFEPEVIHWIVRKKVTDISTEVLPNYLNRIFAYSHDGLHRDIGSLGSLIAAQSDNKRSTSIRVIDEWQSYFDNHKVQNTFRRLIAEYERKL
jgi:mannose-1-phosphate guanylyltransferase